MLFSTLRFIFNTLWRVRICGDLTQLEQQRLLITPNYTSIIDGVLLAVFLPQRLTFVVQPHHLGHWFFRFATRYADFIAVDETKSVSLRRIINLVKQGRPVVLFPEGRITVTGSLMKIYPGAAFIAVRADAVIVPIWLDGVKFTLFSRLKGLFRRRLLPRVRISIGEAHKIVKPAIRLASRRRALGSERLRQIMMISRLRSRRDNTLFEALLQSASFYGWLTDCIQDATLEKWSYYRFIKHILYLSRVLNRVTSANETVGLLLANSVDYAGLIFAATVVDRVPALLNYNAGASGLDNAIKAGKINRIITSREFLQQANLFHLPRQLTQVKWLYLEDLIQKPSFEETCWLYSKLINPASVLSHRDSSRHAVILFTSGSTGIAKGVVHSHSSLLANVEQIRTVADLTPRDKFMAALPLFQAYGLTACLLTPLIAGSKVLLYPNPADYRAIPELIYQQDCSILFASPTFLSHYARYAHPYDFARLRYVISGAEALSENIRQIWLENFGIRILEGYGVTECAPVITANLPMVNRWNTVGCALPEIQTRVVSVPGIKNGGALQLKGPNLMSGYLCSDQPGILQPVKAVNSDGVEESGWYDTNDIVSFDKEGFCTILGRVGRFTKVAGEMLPLETVERLAAKAAPLAAHIATSRNDVNKGESIVLFTTANNLSYDILVKVANDMGIATLAVPKDIRVLPEMPLLANGKYDLALIREMADSPPHFFN